MIGRAILIAAILGLPPVPVPADNPGTPQKVALGRKLFFEPRLSSTGKVSCATCHVPEKAFCDQKPVSAGIDDLQGAINAPTVLNAAYAPHLFWDGREGTLEQQILYPITHPREMNMTKTRVVALLNADAEYRAVFHEAFGTEAITFAQIGQAIASFERTLLSGDSPFDRFYFAKDEKALGESARRGWDLFRGRAGCVRCHAFRDDSPFFTDYEFHNSGIGWDHPKPELGRYTVTREPQDRGRFRTPSLRNVALTAPYMHDGRFATLGDVLAHYQRGGIANPYLDERIRPPLALTEAERADLIAFLQSLTGNHEESHAPPSR